MGVRTPKSELARKVMGEYTFRTHEGQRLEVIRSLHWNKTSKQREIREESERQSASAMPDGDDGDLQREFAMTILEENLSNTPANDPAHSQHSTHTSPSAAANVSTNLPSNPSPLSDTTSSRRHI
ncbi:hypothetical protein R1sor_024763 [Riccia sorocarpa]|uniref:Uncharacterized protein n=1 Tax=Riccia sorocarpa TaxID=122646 RepID=A0ABD3GTN8_9MARC